MTRKRKRRGYDALDEPPNKAPRTAYPRGSAGSGQNNPPPAVQHAVLSHHYPRVLTLRAFLLSRLPPSSRIRRRKILAFGKSSNDTKSSLIDTTLVGILHEPKASVEEARKRDYIIFTQTQQRSVDSSGRALSDLQIEEAIQFCIWTLFKRATGYTYSPKHVLCHGFRKGAVANATDPAKKDALSISGIVQHRPNENVHALLQEPWTEILSLLGSSLLTVLQNLLLDCGIFVLLETGKENFYQLSGVLLTDLRRSVTYTDPTSKPRLVNGGSSHRQNGLPRQPNQITFVRNRMFHAKPSLNAKGEVRFGIKHLHVLNRFPDVDKHDQTVHVMKYIFPRQFHLHNVFTSQVDKRETSQPFKDYTMRDAEIREACVANSGPFRSANLKIPRRLRGGTEVLVKKIRKSHETCSYTQLLRHYCASDQAHWSAFPHDQPQGRLLSSRRSPAFTTQEPPMLSTNTVERTAVLNETVQAESSVMQFATPVARVSAFCQSVISRLLPRDSLGEGTEGRQNWQVLLREVDLFLRIRQLEKLTLHQAMQGLKVSCISWLCPAGVCQQAKMAQSDLSKRHEILQEFVYYVFDSILIPLVRSNFYVTATAITGKAMLYFRHDVWRKISEPSLAMLKLRMLEPLPSEKLRTLLKSQWLGYGQLRLVPKAKGMRPIVNLSGRAMLNLGGKKVLTKSVNTQLRGTLNALRYEQVHQAPRLGSAIFSVSEIHGRLAQFASSLGHVASKRLYFVKVDIKSCFDTIPHEELLGQAKELFSEVEYQSIRYNEVKAANSNSERSVERGRQKFIERAFPAGEPMTFSKSIATEVARIKRRTVFVDTGQQSSTHAGRLLKLLREHVENNIIKVGKKYFRQKNGIPQGSVLSSLLCSFFYGAFEQEKLCFLKEKPSLLLRLIDDFLLVTVDEQAAKQFSEVMAAGAPAYGISINPHKSLANFELCVQGSRIPRLHGSPWFPYCGMAIHVETLDVSRHWESNQPHVSNSLTIERNGKQGQALQSRILLFFKVRMIAVLSNTAHNTSVQVLCNIYEALMETAVKSHQYCKGLGRKRRNNTLLINAVKSLVELSINLVRERSRAKIATYVCEVTRPQMCWLVASAFGQVWNKKQASYRDVMVWLTELRVSQEAATRLDMRTLDMIMARGAEVFSEHVF